MIDEPKNETETPTETPAETKEGMGALEALKTESSPEAPEASDSDKAPESAPATPAEPQIDTLGRSYATGRRKDASARVWVKRGSGKIQINGKEMKDYFARPVLQMLLAQPFEAAARTGEYDVVATVKGGGLSGQAGAVRHGISHALIRHEPNLRPALKAGGFLTRDSRTVERKKYGKAKARKSFQFSKR